MRYDQFLKWWYTDHYGGNPVKIIKFPTNGVNIPIFKTAKPGDGMTHKTIQFPLDPHQEIRDL